MRKFFPLILAMAVGLGGYFYFNHDQIYPIGAKKIYVYDFKDYKGKKPSPLIKIEEKNLVSTVSEAVKSSSAVTGKEVSLTNPNYILEIRYQKDKIKIFELWLSENTTSGMIKDNSDNNFSVLSKEGTNKLKTLIFR